ncbi:MAG: succinate dehydrogenase/fumarate reductase cytochrome b subunit, partial [Alistipes sp.]|nr:succinate dehydrogenase/fumarate reductase cytochrome b subunit [Alistipes sp.]
GFIVLAGLVLHLFNFWAKMQLVEIMCGHASLVGGHFIAATDGAALIAYTFSQWYYVAIYLLWFAALWFHLTHGVWSMFQTVGWANDTWYPRLKCIANAVATLVFLGFAAVVVIYFIKSCCTCCCGA